MRTLRLSRPLARSAITVLRRWATPSTAQGRRSLPATLQPPAARVLGACCPTSPRTRVCTPAKLPCLPTGRWVRASGFLGSEGGFVKASAQKLAVIAPKCFGFGPTSSRFGPKTVEIRANSIELGPKLVRFRQTLGANSIHTKRVRPMSGQVFSEFDRIWPDRCMLGQWHRSRPNVARNRPMLARSRPMSDKCQPSSANIGPEATKGGPSSTQLLDFDRAQPKSARLRPNLLRLRPMLGRSRHILARFQPNLGHLGRRTDIYSGTPAS